MESIRTIGVITARGGSKGIPRKNVKPLAGKPLIAWTIEAAQKSRLLDRLIVSTDDPEIMGVAMAFGAEVPFRRPAELARDESTHLDTVLHSLDWLREHGDVPDYFLTLQPTSPLRIAEDIDAAIDLARASHLPAVISVCESRQHPLWAKQIHADGTMSPYVSHKGGLRRQLLLPAFAPNGAIYLNRCDSLIAERQMAPAGTRAYVMPMLRSVDIDTPDDWYLAELLLRDRHEIAQAA